MISKRFVSKITEANNKKGEERGRGRGRYDRWVRFILSEFFNERRMIFLIPLVFIVIHFESYYYIFVTIDDKYDDGSSFIITGFVEAIYIYIYVSRLIFSLKINVND